MEVHVLKQLLQTFPRISNHVVEPSAELSAKYKTYASEHSSELKGVDYNWNQLLLQDYKAKRDKEGDQTKFHFISAIHSLYYFDDLGKWLDYLYGLLEEGGLLMVMITAGKEWGISHLHTSYNAPWLEANIRVYFDSIAYCKTKK